MKAVLSFFFVMKEPVIQPGATSGPLGVSLPWLSGLLQYPQPPQYTTIDTTQHAHPLLNEVPAHTCYATDTACVACTVVDVYM